MLSPAFHVITSCFRFPFAWKGLALFTLKQMWTFKASIYRVPQNHTMPFLYSKIMVLVNVSRITIISNLQVGALTYDDQYSGEDGFFIAAAFTAYDSETEPIDDPRYGDLTMEYYGWGYEGAISTKNTPLGTHRCSDEELGLSNDVEYPIFATSANEVATYKKKF